MNIIMVIPMKNHLNSMNVNVLLEIKPKQSLVLV
jgi:hypothetical protein